MVSDLDEQFHGFFSVSLVPLLDAIAAIDSALRGADNAEERRRARARRRKGGGQSAR